MAKRREQHTALIDALAAVLFPFQESEFEAETFTDVGRQRVDEWLGQRVCVNCRAHAFLSEIQPSGLDEPPTLESEAALSPSRSGAPALRALIAKWRTDEGVCYCSIHCECDASGYQACADQLEAALSLSRSGGPEGAAPAVVSPPLIHWAAQLVRIVAGASLTRHVDQDVAEPVRRVALQMRDWHHQAAAVVSPPEGEA